MPRSALALAVIACLSSSLPVSTQGGKDDPEPVIRAMVLAMYSNDVAAYDKVTVAQLVAQASAKTGENIQISRFVRFRVGEGAEA